jgi:3-phosphoshikimate 1-carboxyvinyltransferase
MSRVILEGFVLPPDKSILHRLLIIGSLSKAEIVVPSHSQVLPEDIEATIECLQALGVTIDRTPTELRIHGVGMSGWKTPNEMLNCHNSGTTARLLTGALCGQPLSATLVGDESLSKRPMKRLAVLLDDHFGANVQIAANDGLPATISGRSLHPANVSTPVASAQLKSALLLAAIQTIGVSTISEPSLSRDHTEKMLKAFGVDIRCSGTTAEIHSEKEIPLSGKIVYDVPRDISATYYLIVAAMLQKRPAKFTNVLLNSTRGKLLDLFCKRFDNIETTNQTEQWNEMRGDISVDPTDLQSLSLQISKEDIPLLIDELPLLAVMAAFFDGQVIIEDAAELRYKESDRIRLIIKNLLSFGLKAEEMDDGFIINGNSNFKPREAVVDHGGDHRIAMAFSLMAAKTAVTIPNPSVVNVSFPGYFSELEKIIGEDRIKFI